MGSLNLYLIRSLAEGMDCNQMAVMKNTDKIRIAMDFDLLAHETGRNRIAVCLKSDEAVLSHMPDHTLLKDIRRPPSMIDQQLSFLLKHLDGLAMSGTVDSLVGRSTCLAHQGVVEMFEGIESLAPEEALDILDS